jgi:hypothetical protein
VLNKTELFEALEAFSPRRRAIYEIARSAWVAASAILSAAVIAGLSTQIARWLVTSDLPTDAMIGAVIMPSVMAFVFVATGVRSASDPRFGKARNMAQAAWGGVRAGFVVGLVVVGFAHFLGQLLLTRAIYGPLEFQGRVFSYCGPIPVLYGLFFALPVAAGAGLFAAFTAVSAQVVYEVMAALGGHGRVVRQRDGDKSDASPTHSSDRTKTQRGLWQKRRVNADIPPIMGCLPRDELLMTLVSLWSAMLGGAIGAATGRFGGPLACHVTFGFIGGLVSSVILYLPLMGVAQAIDVFIMHRESEGRAVGGLASDKLAGLLGGVAGAVGAVVVAALPGNVDLFDPRVSVICWTAVAFVTIILSLAVVYYVRWKERT